MTSQVRKRGWLRKSLRFVWRQSLWVTGPLAAVFLLWAFRTTERFYEFGVRYGGEVGRIGLHHAGTFERDRLRAGLRVALLEDSPEVETELAQVHLMINEGSERSLDSHLPFSGRKYRDGFLKYPNGELGKVDMRYRGDFPWHWATPKKSWRIKTSRSAMWNNMRAFNLIVPKGKAMVEDALGYWLASEMNLLGPSSEMVEVVVNGKGRGLYLLVEQLEELVLRKNNRMPGDIYAGELIGRDSYDGISENVFQHPATWDKVSINNHFDDGENLAIRRLCELLDEPATESNARALGELVDLQAFGRFAAFRIITQTEHFDRIHNWRLFYDPWKNRFEPIVWDAVPWHTNWMPRRGEEPFLDVRFCELDDRLLEHHQYRLAVIHALRDFFQGGLAERTLAKYDSLVEEVAGALDRDPTLNFGMKYVSPDEVRTYQQAWRKQVAGIFAKLEETYVDNQPLLSFSRLESQGDRHGVRIAVYGRASVDGLRFEFKDRVPQATEVQVQVDSKGATHSLAAGPKIRTQMRYMDLELPMTGGLTFVPNPESKSYVDRGHMVLTPISYDVWWQGPVAQADLVRVSALQGGRNVSSLTELESMPIFAADGEIGVLPPVLESEPIRWSGVIEFSGQRVIQAPVVIEPGTVLRMAANASIILEGPLIAQGTQEKPIQIIPMETDQEPWGTFALRGPGSDGSVLRFVEMRGGSGWKEPLAEYSSMFSIHHVQDLSVVDCLFIDSYIVDDMVHGVYSSVTFQRCEFVRSLADALDMDISTVAVLDCTFRESGNDSVDLMTAQARVENTRFLQSRDKGISIGENSTLFARNCLFDGCEIGLQSKDESQAAVINSDILNCNWGVDAYKKNWRYNGGGEIYVYKSRLLGNNVDLRADKHSQVVIADSSLTRVPEIVPDSIHMGRFIATGASPRAGLTVGTNYRFEREKELLAPLGESIWSLVNEAQRGSDFPMPQQ